MAPALLTPGTGVGALVFALVFGLLLAWVIIDGQYRASARSASDWAARARLHMRAYRQLARGGTDSAMCSRLMRLEYDSAIDCARRAAQFREQIPPSLRRRYLH